MRVLEKACVLGSQPKGSAGLPGSGITCTTRARRSLSGERPSQDQRKYVIEFLEKAGVEFSLVEHSPAFSSQSAAMQAHVSGNDIGKAVLVRLVTDIPAKEEIVMCMLRAPDRIDLRQFANLQQVQHAHLLTEAEVQEETFKKGLPVEEGAVPPLPQLFKCRSFMDSALADLPRLHFNAGVHQCLVSVAQASFQALTKPSVLCFAHEIDSHIREVQRMFNVAGTKGGFVVHYHVMRHSHSETAQQTAKAVGVPRSALVKAVGVYVDGKPALCALCSSKEVDMGELKKVAGVERAELAGQRDVQGWLPASIQVGAIPPFGHMFSMPLFIDASIATKGGSTQVSDGGHEIVFNAGSHTEAISMRYDDYLRVVSTFQEPAVGNFTKEFSGKGREQ